MTRKGGTRKKKQAATGWPWWKHKILELKRGSARSHRTRCGGGYRPLARQTM